MIVDLAVAEQREQPLDLFVADSAPEADAVNVIDGHKHRRLVGYHSQMVETASCSQDGFGFDALNDAESVVWVNDLVTDLECHMSPTEVRCVGWVVRPMSSPLSITNPVRAGNEKPTKSGRFLAFSCTFQVHTRQTF